MCNKKWNLNRMYRFLLRVLIDKAASQDSTFNLTADELLGTGKNKFYKKGT